MHTDDLAKLATIVKQILSENKDPERLLTNGINRLQQYFDKQFKKWQSETQSASLF